GKRLCKVGLAAAGRADHHDVRLGDFNLFAGKLCTCNRGGCSHALVMVVDGDCERLFRSVLTDDVLVEEPGDLARLVEREIARLCGLMFGKALFNDLVAQRNALIADVNLRACNELSYLLLRFTAE